MTDCQHTYHYPRSRWHTFVHISTKLIVPYWIIPSSKLLWTCRRPLLGPRFFGTAFLPWSATSFEHFAQSNPPFGPALLYGVTVKRFPHFSQFSSCPGIGRDFSSIISFAIISSSSSSLLSSATSIKRRDLRRENSLLCLIFASVVASFRLRFFFCSGNSPACVSS